MAYLQNSSSETLQHLALYDQAGLQDRVDRACTLFEPAEMALLEWMDDVSLMEEHGYGSRINYEIASPLLADLHKSLEVSG